MVNFPLLIPIELPRPPRNHPAWPARWGQRMTLENKERIDRRLLLFVGGAAVLVLSFYLVVILPRAHTYQHTLRSLRPEQVRTLRLHTEGSVDGRMVTVERSLQGEELARFLALVSAATSYSPNHPKGGWTCFVDIHTTTDIPHFSFLIHLTSNNGVHFYLMSNGHDGWNYGSLRNDALGPFLEALFHPAK